MVSYFIEKKGKECEKNQITLYSIFFYYNMIMKTKNKIQTIQLGIYKHYKGNLYEVLSTARHSETEEWMVIYRVLYEDASVWVRPYDMFTEIIEMDGKQVERFAYMGKKEKK